MRRLLLTLIVPALLALCAAPALASAPAATSCRGTNAPGTFPDVQRLQAAHASCSQAVSVAVDIQSYWKAHASATPTKALAPRAAGFACRYQLRHEPAGDPYYHASCQLGSSLVQMDLTS